MHARAVRPGESPVLGRSVEGASSSVGRMTCLSRPVAHGLRDGQRAVSYAMNARFLYTQTALLGP